MLTRRDAIRGLGLAGGGLFLSKLVPDLFGINVQAATIFEAGTVEGFAAFLEAETEMGDFEMTGEARLLSPQEALFELNKIHGLNTRFTNNPGYSQAEQCLEQFKSREACWRKGNVNYFTDVQRSKLDNDVAYMLGGAYNANAWTRFTGATQFEDKPAIVLADDAPSVLAVSAHTFNASYNLKPYQFARSATLTSDPQNVNDQNGNYFGTSYATPQTDVIYYRKPVQGTRHSYKGLVGVRPKNTAEKWRVMGVYV